MVVLFRLVFEVFRDDPYVDKHGRNFPAGDDKSMRDQTTMNQENCTAMTGYVIIVTYKLVGVTRGSHTNELDNYKTDWKSDLPGRPRTQGYAPRSVYERI